MNAALAPENSLLTRVLEPEVMDSAAEALDYDTMDHSEVNRRFTGDFLAALDQSEPPSERVVLDLGTGTAQIPIELCRQDTRVRVVAIDLADEMLKLARTNVARCGLAARIELERVDAKGLPFADGQFAAVMSNSIVHHIPQPRGALAEAMRVTRPGGLIFVRDLSRPRDDEQVHQLVDQYAAGANPHQRQLFETSLRAALSLREIRQLVGVLGFSAETVQATSDRHWTWTARKGH